ncbi:hypothetical protein K493DRAFT_270021 [Basidiobolus meristosporus CBS 931.73]|uniref:PAS domain-containing protein n=1 Tax=Basidiobolus meristosporus CBS 931.73 TaxID=1314790 RepID=A0A1Y1XAW7_9FUNG|nr:hypothetical protein K493DRAFT_270021 [Basidiobolus meristosporus CBS 931.73]|eukprot:ORX82576.1 hypothetical protein K493DRAFT_270021 [Basidiobolus meristosporus CBS 931.73]
MNTGDLESDSNLNMDMRDSGNYNFTNRNYDENSNGETSMSGTEAVEPDNTPSDSYLLNPQLFNSVNTPMMGNLASSGNTQFTPQPLLSGYATPLNINLSNINTDPGKLASTTLGNFPGLYSNSGFDMLSILARVANRPNPQINLGPVDMSCAFLVVDARQFDFPVVYASQSFENLTGYSDVEVIGRNCRFLQSPDGQVTLGSRRRYTDNNTVHHIKKHILQGKEVQVSFVNYKKGGQPFVNLLTIIPIAYGDGEEITHFVGFQVNLIDQPNNILQKMQDGTYMVNYNMMSIQPLLCSGIFQRPLDESLNTSTMSPEFPATAEVYELVEANEASDQEVVVKLWNQLLLEHSDDFIHVLSLKGIFLYCSPSSKRVLGYEPEELIGRNISMLCEPSDLIPLMRDLREASSSQKVGEPLCFLYRIKSKDSGYFWFEVQGRLYSENEKVRKCVVLAGRPRPFYKLSVEALQQCGGLSEREFWSKLTLDGMYLYVTNSSMNILKLAPEELVGTTLYQMMRFDRATALTRALQQVAEGTTVKLKHKMLNKKGELVDVVSTFYPGDAVEGKSATFILCQSKEAVDSEGSSDDTSTTSSAPSPQTNQKPSITDNLFSTLDPGSNSTWQYELHRLRIANQRLRDELQSLANRKRGRELLA